jgi:hypothetical protein
MNQTANGVISSIDALIDLLESIEQFVNRLDIYTQIPLTPAMIEIMVKIIVELSPYSLWWPKNSSNDDPVSAFSPPSSPTQCDAVKYVKKLLGEKDVEAVLQRLDRLTQDEARNTAAETLMVVHSLFHNTSVVMEGKQTYSVFTRPFI